MRPNGKWVLVTGASTGLGRACALYLAERGYQVIATVRTPADQESLRGELIWPELLEVRDAGSIAAMAKRTKELAGDGLCGIVNNAGIGVVGPIEHVAIEDWRKQFEVNVFGAVAVTQAMLPLLRRHVTEIGPGASRIIMMGSIAGKVSQPIMAPYCASKFALEAICDALRLELRGQGIHTVLIEPGAIQSEIWRKGQESADAIGPDHPAREHYRALTDQITILAGEAGKHALPADRVAKVVATALERRVPRTRYVIGRDARIATYLKRLLSDRIWDRLVLRAIRVKP